MASFDVEEVEIDVTIPSDKVGFVVFQPYLEISPESEPYRWKDEKTDTQIEHISRCLYIANQANHNCAKTHFTILPEYSIPGLAGIQLIQETLLDSGWESGTVVIGGIDGLAKDDYSALVSHEGTTVHARNLPTEVQDYEWVNCCVIWVKESSGTVRRWVQPKLVPAWPEKRIRCLHMFRGKCVYVFGSKFENKLYCRFLPLICFDWIGQIGANKGIWAFLSGAQQFWEEGKKERPHEGREKKHLHFVFLLQHNEVPNDSEFLGNAKGYFADRNRYPLIDRDNCAVLFANSAGGPAAGKHSRYGRTSLICSPTAAFDTEACPPTYAVRTKTLRGCDDLKRCKDTLFRENGACIHSFGLCPPEFVNSDASGRTHAVDRALVCSIDGDVSDPRTPDGPVPASVKWINDELDDVCCILAARGDHQLLGSLQKVQDEIKLRLRRLSGDILCRFVEAATCGYDKWVLDTLVHDVDQWNTGERWGFGTAVRSLAVIGLCKNLEIGQPRTHATMEMTVSGNTLKVNLLVVSGNGMHRECFEYGMQQDVDLHRFTIVITRDGDNSLVDRTSRSILEGNRQIGPDDPPITEPSARFIHVGYRNIWENCISAKNLKELDGRLWKGVSA